MLISSWGMDRPLDHSKYHQSFNSNQNNLEDFDLLAATTVALQLHAFRQYLWNNNDSGCQFL